MGAHFQFTCAGCGYSTEVSGGDDCGMVASTTTIVCEDCQSLYDVTTGLRSESGEFKEHLLRCPKSARHKVKAWKDGDPCPKCGHTLSKGEMTCLWD